MCVLWMDDSMIIRRYVFISELDVQLEYCQLAASLFKVGTLMDVCRIHSQVCSFPQSILCSSLPHPLSSIEYASYPQQSVFVPGVLLLQDDMRCHVSTSLLSSLAFCGQQLVSRNYSLQVCVSASLCTLL